MKTYGKDNIFFYIVQKNTEFNFDYDIMKFIITFLIVFFLNGILFAQWQKSVGKYSNEYVFYFLKNENKIFAGSKNKILISTDGIKWNDCINGFKGDVLYICENNKVLYAASEFRKSNDTCSIILIDIKYSRDFGNHWENLSSLSIKSSPNCFLFQDSLLLVGAMNGLYISKNFGKTWNIKKFNKDLRITSIVSTNNKIYVGLRGEMYYTDNKCITWNKFLIENMPLANISDFIFVDNYMYIATSDIGVFKLDLSNNTLLPFDNNILPNVVRGLHLYLCNTMIATTHHGIFYFNLNNQWYSFNEGLPKHNDEYNPVQSSILTENKLIIYLVNDGICYRDINIKLE